MNDVDLRRHHADYGIDGDFRLVPAVWQMTILGTIVAALAALTVIGIAAGRTVLAASTGVITVWLLLTSASYAYTTRVGKFRVWARVLAELGLRGDEDLLDLGCGRGAVLLAAAKLLPAGRAVGVDLWRADQTGNSPEATLRNAEREGVAARVAVHSGDMTSLPFDDQSFDVVVSSLAIHNIPDASGRAAAIDEAVRVLRPGGRVLIADLGATKSYVARLRSLGLADTERRNLGWQAWWGGPWFPTRLVTARATQAATNCGGIHVCQDGPRDAPALVLIHGTGGSVCWWDALVPLVASSHRVIRVDLLGHGRSAEPAGPGYEIPEQGRRIGAALDMLGVRQAVVVGHSTGGSVATALAEHRPDLVTALALIGTGPRPDAFISQGRLGGLLLAPGVGPLLWRLRTDGLIRKALSTGFSRPGYQIPQQLVDDARGITYGAFTATSRAALDYLTERALPERLAALGTPLLVIFGEEDRRWRPASAADYRAVPGARVEWLPGLGHSPMLEDPPRTAALLLAFTAPHAEPVD